MVKLYMRKGFAYPCIPQVISQDLHKFDSNTKEK
jgi:hypothetical protein